MFPGQEAVGPGSMVGGYRVESPLGAGGFGSVWLASNPATGERVALKFLAAHYAGSDATRQRQEIELKAAGAAAHSRHVVRVLGGGTAPMPYIIMEFVNGTSLAAEIERRGRLSQEETLTIARGVADALRALEAVDIVHRDVKPANIMVDWLGTVKLVDFGIAKIAGYQSVTATGQLLLSVPYAAPEVWDGRVSHRSDLYALGCVLYQCLSGQPPFAGGQLEVFRGHMSAEPDLSRLSPGTLPEMASLIADLLAKTPEGRPSADAVLGRLAAIEAGLTQRSRPQDRPPASIDAWAIEAPHPAVPWAFRCVHRTTGQRATVEVYFTDDIELGNRLRKVVDANAALTPLGAERLLGTNRLVLGPGEAWPNQPARRFMFWVAREDGLPAAGPAPPSTADVAAAGRAITELQRRALEVGVEPRGSYRVLPGGRIYLPRPGLPPVPGPVDAPAARPSPVAPAVPVQTTSEATQIEPSRYLGATVVPPPSSQAMSEMTQIEPSRHLGATVVPPASSQGMSEMTQIEPSRHFAQPAPPASAPVPVSIRTPSPLTSAPPPPGPVPAAPARKGPPWLLIVGGAALVAVVAVVVAVFALGGGDGGETPIDEDASPSLSTATAPVTNGTATATETAATSTPPVTTSPAATGDVTALGPRAVRVEGPYRDVAIAALHVCAIREADGAPECWGYNRHAQADAPDDSGFVHAVAGFSHTCGLKEDGSVRCWGPSFDAAATAPSGQFNAIAAGDYYGCGIAADGAIVCWGDGNDGQTTPPPGHFVAIDAGPSHVCAIEDGTGAIACWGNSDDDRTLAPAVRPGDPFVEVSVGDRHACARTESGSVACWGNNDFQQAAAPDGVFMAISAADSYTCGLADAGIVACWGLRTSDDAPALQYTRLEADDLVSCGLDSEAALVCWGYPGDGRAVPPDGQFVAVSTGDAHSCAIATDGLVACWGGNTYDQSEPPLESFTQIATGGSHTCGVTSSQEVRCWGDDSRGQALAPAGSFAKVAAGAYHSCGLETSGAVVCWGDNPDGQATPPDGNFFDIAAGGDATCALRGDGTMACWGDLPGSTEALSGAFTALAVGRDHLCAVRADGSVVCAGANDVGQGSPPAGSFVTVTTGGQHTCGVKDDGTVACWGANGNGQATAPEEGFSQVGAGDLHTCGLRDDGMLACWGWNGEVGPRAD